MAARNEPSNAAGAFADAAARTLGAADDLGVLWGPRARATLTVYGVSHDDLHALDGHAFAFREPDSTAPAGALVGALAETRLGWLVAFYGKADEACPLCRDLAVEAGDEPETPTASGEHAP